MEKAEHVTFVSLKSDNLFIVLYPYHEEEKINDVAGLWLICLLNRIISNIAINAQALQPATKLQL
jgi:hypothetical protein